MNNAVKVYTFLVVAFVLIMSVSGMLGEPYGIIIKILGYGVPVFIGYLASRKFKREREEAAGVAENESTLIGIEPRRLAALLPTVMPTLALIFAVSYLTSLLLGMLGLEATTVEDAPLLEMLLLHALMPSVLEELLFRYLPMKLVAPYSKRSAIVLSSLYFALIHMNLYQLPYALIAGAIFITIDVYADSVLPSFILHLLNNAISVLWIKYSSSVAFASGFAVTLVALAALSLIPIIIKRRKYLAALSSTLDAGEALTDRYAPTLFIAFTALMTVFNHL